MKRAFSIFTCLSILLIFSAFTSSDKQTTSPITPGAYKIIEVAYLWDLVNNGYEPNQETDGTWLETGLRSKYAVAKNYASLEILETTFGTKVFLRGPHQDGIDYNSTTSFGYYNPDFIAQVKSSIEEALSNPIYKKAIANVYRNYLQNMAQTYMEAYRHINRDQKLLAEFKTQYIMDMARPEGTMDGSFQETFRPFAESLEKEKGADIYEAFTAPAFWIRRSIDGTGPAIFQLLEMVDKELKE